MQERIQARIAALKAERQRMIDETNAILNQLTGALAELELLLKQLNEEEPA